MNDESGESMEPMEEVPLEGLTESELERLVRGLGYGEKPEVDFRERGSILITTCLISVETVHTYDTDVHCMAQTLHWVWL